MKIIVPATSANIGPGFDSVGVAVTKYLQIEVCEERDEWLIEHQIGKWIPHDERNLLFKIALQIAPDLQPRRLKMTSDVPLACGLGSSSSVIVAGIELANQLGNLNLSNHDKLQLATKIEGHPDNVVPAIYGNLVIASSCRICSRRVSLDSWICRICSLVLSRFLVRLSLISKRRSVKLRCKSVLTSLKRSPRANSSSF